MNELNTIIEKTEATLQDARGDLSIYEGKFPTDSAEAQLIEELIERLDEASDPETLRETIVEYADEYDVDRENIKPSEVNVGDIIFVYATVAEVIAIDGWVRGNVEEYEFTIQQHGREAETFVLSATKSVDRALDI